MHQPWIDIFRRSDRVWRGWPGNGIRRGHDGHRERLSATAVASCAKRGDGVADDVGGVLRIAIEDGDDLIDGNAVVIGMPAIVVGDHGDGDVADFGFAGELGLLQVGHADDVKSGGSVEVAFGFGGELRAFHADVGAAAFGDDSGGYAGFGDGGGEFGTDGVSEGDVGDDAFSEEGGDALLGAVEELVGMTNSWACALP